MAANSRMVLRMVEVVKHVKHGESVGWIMSDTDIQIIDSQNRMVGEALSSWWQVAGEAYAPETMRAVEGDLRHWAAWCDSVGVAPWPVTVEALVGWISGYVGALASLRRRLASLRMVARAGGADPTAHERVRLAMKAAGRRLGAPQTQATAWGFLESATERGGGLRKRESPLVRIRDQAIVALAYDSLARCSEIRNISVSDVLTSADNSGTVLIRRSKTDQTGVGSWRYLAVETMVLLSHWMRQAMVADGPLFRPLYQGEKAGKEAMSGMAVWRVYQRMGKRVPGAASFSPHSTRVGAAVDMVVAGLAMPEIMQAGGWQSPEMVARYTAKTATGKGAAAKLAKMQNRS